VISPMSTCSLWDFGEKGILERGMENIENGLAFQSAIVLPRTMPCEVNLISFSRWPEDDRIREVGRIEMEKAIVPRITSVTEERTSIFRDVMLIEEIHPLAYSNLK